MNNAGLRFGLVACLRFGLVACLLAFATGHALAQPDAATALLGQHTRLTASLLDNPFGRPLVLDSLETSDGLQGDIYAVVAHPFNAVRAGLNQPENWCEVMILHINTKYCRATTGRAGSTLRVYIGKKTPQTLAEATQVDFQYQETAATPSYFSTTLKAKTGPLGTSDYLIRLEAVALSKTTSFLHLTYAYGVGFAGRMAMQAYLSTLGSDKVGFTLVDQGDGGKPDFVAGVRGVVERNTMRYYLAIDSYLASQNELPEAQLEKRLQSWFTAVERYPRQLHEVDRPAYLEMKRAEVKRQHNEL